MRLLKEQLLRAAIAVLLVAAPLAQAQDHAPAKRQQYLYVLRVAPQMQDEAKWKDSDRAVTMRHFERLKKATESGQVILAGRTTSEPLDKTFGLVIFEADGEQAARAFMEADPAVQAGLMTATLHPYSVLLQRAP